MRYVTKDKAPTLAFYLPSRPSTAGSAVVYGAGGDALQSSPTVTLDSVNTTLSGAASAGAATLALTSASGVVAGRRYLVGGAEETVGETVTVASLSGTTATLARRLRRAQASGATVHGCRLSVAITTATSAAVQRNCRVEWTSPDDPYDVVVVPFDVVRWSLAPSATIEDLRALDPLFHKRIPDGTWLPDVFATAWEIVTDDLATKDRVPGGFAGVLDLARAHAYVVLALLEEANTRDDDTVRRLDDLRTRYTQERDRTLTSIAYDPDGDGTADTGTGQWRGFKLVRG